MVTPLQYGDITVKRSTVEKPLSPIWQAHVLMVATKDYRAAFISDTHLRIKGSKATQLAEFVDNRHSDRLYPMGDLLEE